jgi:endoglucanase Acf2
VSLVALLAACSSPLSSVHVAALPPPPAAHPVAVGKGFYLEDPPVGEKVPSTTEGTRAIPKVTAAFNQLPMSHKWWTSLMWENDREHRKNPYSENMYPNPLAMRAHPGGLGMGFAPEASVERDRYNYWLREDLVVGIDALASPDTRVDSYGDWTVTAAWDDGTRHLRATAGRGLPFVYFTATGGAATVTLPSADPAQLWVNKGDTVGVVIRGVRYGIFGPTGSHWALRGAVLSSTLAGRDYFSVAALPDASEQTLAAFRAHAFAFVTGSRIDFAVDAKASTVTTTFTVDVTSKEGGTGASEPLLALYRHQWMHTDAPTTDWSYPSPRGAMKVISGHAFTTETKITGLLPLLPPPGDAPTRERVESALSEAMGDEDWFPVGADWTRSSYWDGKSMQRLATLARIAEALGKADLRTKLIQGLERGMEDWFDGVTPRAFFYDKTWHALIPTPGAFGSGAELNDHHFHYGYFIQAAAAIAQLDPGWVERYGPFVDLLIQDVATTDRDSTRFPFLRYYDVYAGHSWASGDAPFDEGNNEESSSEDTNFAAGVALWGAQTNRPALRDLGLWMLSTEAEAILQYWFDADQAVFPKGFKHPLVAMVWDAGGRYNTWWDPNPIFVHGINVFPVTSTSLYLGYRPEVIERDYDYLVRENRGDPLVWRDILWKDLALADPRRATQLYEQNRYFTEDQGDSRANILYWLGALRALGRVDTTMTADSPTAVTFRRGDIRTHVAYNPGAAAARVTFSDGTHIDVAPGRTEVLAGPVPSASPSPPPSTVARGERN